MSDHEALAHIEAEYAKLEQATRQRISGLVGGRRDRDTVERAEWGRFYDLAWPLIVQREALRGRAESKDLFQESAAFRAPAAAVIGAQGFGK